MSIFSKNQKTNIPYNVFDLTHDKKLTARMGYLIPTLVMDVVPGDQVKISTSQMIRFAPLVAPIMHQVSVYQHYFYVPNRILWDKWEDFITGGEDGLQEPVWPYLQQDFGLDPGEFPYDNVALDDYMGLPDRNYSGEPTTRQYSAIPFAAYQKIYDDYYKDQNLVPEDIPTKLVEGNNTGQIGINAIRRRAWQHDYFTSGLPWPQKGPETLIPLGEGAPVRANTQAIEQDEDIGIQTLRHLSSPLGNAGSGDVISDPNGEIRASNGSIPSFIDLGDSHYADLSQATSASITDLRRAFKLQEFLERQARGGTRYTEVIYAQFGVTSSDSRLQRPQYLGGFRTPIKISEVLQTSQTETSPQGTMAGHAIAVGGNQSVGCYAEEHGYIIGIMSIMPRSAYFQGIPKHMLRRDKFDYYWESFAHIGEQPIEDMEIYQEPNEDGKGTFAYTPRYIEYKYIPNTVHREFRRGLDYWTISRKFDSKPALNRDFIEMDWQEAEHIFVGQGVETDNIYVHILNNVKAKRKMPFFGTPKF